MKENRRKLGTGIVIGAVGLLALMGLGGLAVVYTGAYNVAATEEHTALVRWAFHTTMHESVQGRAPEAGRMEAITPAMLGKAGQTYAATCQHCHGGPGVQRPHWAAHMRPQPPHLVEAAAHWEPGEVFWIVKHGLKMSGMPAFGPNHEDEAIWAIAAFVKELPAMSPERYAALIAGGAGHHAEGGGEAGHHGAGSSGAGDHGHGRSGGGGSGSGSGSPGNHGHGGHAHGGAGAAPASSGSGSRSGEPSR